MNDNKGLLPCAHCGAMPRVVDLAGWEVLCECGISFSPLTHGECASRALTIAAWNARTPEAVAARGEGVWVSVEERLPEYLQDVLVVKLWKGFRPEYAFGFYGSPDWRVRDTFGEEPSFDVPDYWQPLPAAPAPGESQG